MASTLYRNATVITNATAGSATIADGAKSVGFYCTSGSATITGGNGINLTLSAAGISNITLPSIKDHSYPAINYTVAASSTLTIVEVR